MGTKELLQAHFKELQEQVHATRTAAAPLRAKRDELFAQIFPLQAAADALTAQIQELEGPAFVEKKRDLAKVATALGGKKLSGT